MFMRDSQQFDISQPHVIGDVQYPAIWFDDADRRAALGVEEVIDDAQPSFHRVLQKLVENAPEKIGDVWHRTWFVVNLSGDELESSIEHLKESITAAVQLRLDRFAQTRNYDGILSACTYAASSVSKFAAEGTYCINQRDATWAALYNIMAAVEGGTHTMPSGYTDLEAELPTLTWPV